MISSLSRYRNCLFPLFLIIATFIAYLPAWHGGFVWKDDEFILHNPNLNFWQGLYRVWLETAVQYYPLTYTTFWIEYHFWGMNPLGFHLVNIAFHVLDAILLWRVLLRLNVPGAWLGAAIFALHPINVESVAWIVERKNTLSTFFYLCSILAALRFWLPEEIKTPGSRGSYAPLTNWKFFWLSFGFFVCALFSKTTTIPLPAVILLLVWWKRGRITWRDVGLCIPFVIAGILVGLITHHVERNLGAGGKEFQFSLIDRLLLVSRNFWFYLGKLAWPHPLIFVYPRWTIHAASPFAWLPFLALVLVAIVLWLRRNGPWGRPIFVALAYFAGLLFLMLGFFNIFFFLYSFVSDHFVYLACMGPFALLAAAITLGFHRRPGVVSLGYLITSACLLALLAALTWNQSSAYADAETLWRDTIAKNPDAFLARNNLGDLLIQRGQMDAAIEQYEKSVAIYPDRGVYHNLGNSLLARGRTAEAWQVFQKELQSDPNSASAWADFGNACLQIGRTRDAIQYLQKAWQKAPKDPMISYNLGNAYNQNKQLDVAIQYWQKAVELKPYFPMANNNLANAMIFEHRIPEAIQQWQRALAAQPNMVSAQVNLAWVLATCPDPSLRDGPDALALAERATQLTGADPRVLRVLAAAFAENGQYTDAIAAAQDALRMSRANPGLTASLQSQLKLYQGHQPYRDQSLATRN